MHVHDKKRSSLGSQNELHQQISTEARSSSSSAFTRHRAARPPMSQINTNNNYVPLRPDSPPASAYFQGFSNDPGAHAEPTPRENAHAHFAYSTTLVRHHVDDLGTPTPQQAFARGWDGLLTRLSRIVDRWRGIDRDLEDGWTEPRQVPPEDTPSSRFAHCTVEETLAYFHTSIDQGLASISVPSLRTTHGYNEFSVPPTEPMLLKFAKTIYESPLIMLLFGSAFVSAIMGNIDDAVSIALAIIIVLTVGFVQERRSEKSLEALNKLVPHHCHLIRDGQRQHTLANELLPGDLVTFEVGDRIPADLRIISAVQLEIDESSLTGETRPRSKVIDACPVVGATPAPLADRNCVGFMGTLVRNGKGSGIVIATGTETEFGVIFTMMQEVEEKRTPLQHSMDELAQKLSMLSFGIIGVICIIGVLQQRGWLEMFTIGVSLAVAAIPEGLPIVTTVTLALGVLRMSHRKAIVKKLPSVEALGSVSVICSDKTGTLTKNEQTVTEIYTVDEVIQIQSSMHHVPLSHATRKTLEIANLCNNARRTEEGIHVGQSTDVALLNVLDTFGMSDARKTFNVTGEFPFNSEQKFMAVSGTHISDNRDMFYIKGSIEAVLERCKFFYVSDDSTPGLDSVRARITSHASTVASRGLRVLGMAYGYGTIEMASLSPDKMNLVFTGFQAMLDPPRPGVADSISRLHAGSVKVVMITGDAEHTALSIARQLGLRVQPGTTSCMTGREIDSLSSPRELQERVGRVSVFARTTPRHKMAIVKAFQARGEIVAMTGDGVNDAPALKMADIGVSMGKSGTDVAKEAADVILVDDNFATILSAVEEGKSIFYNIQNFLSFQLSTAVAALTLITLSTVFRLSNPLNAMQILFINILMDGPPSQSLGVDPADPQVMRKPPRKKGAPVISQRVVARVLFSASVIVLGTLFVYVYELSDGSMSRRDQTMTFTSFVFLDLASAIQNRGLGCGLFQNKMLLMTVSISFLVQLALIYVSFMQAVFQTESLSMRDLFTLLMLGATSMGLHEGRRHYERILNEKNRYEAVDDFA